jgi:SH3 domain protein
MIVKQLRKLLLIALVALLPATALAANYVSDKLEVPLRSGPGLNYRIITMLKSGQALEVLGESEGWTQVRTGGKEGWTVKRYVSDKLPLRPQLANAKAELEKAKAAQRAIAAKLEQTQKELRKASSQLSKATKKGASLEKEFNKWKGINAGVLEMKSDNERMSIEAIEIAEEVGVLRMENRQLKARKNTYWFICGAIILLLGWALGHIYSTSKGKPKGGFRF